MSKHAKKDKLVDDAADALAGWAVWTAKMLEAASAGGELQAVNGKLGRVVYRCAGIAGLWS